MLKWALRVVLLPYTVFAWFMTVLFLLVLLCDAGHQYACRGSVDEITKRLGKKWWSLLGHPWENGPGAL